MNKLTLAFLLLTLSASLSFGGQVPQVSRKTSADRACGAELKECKESLSDFKEARQFMQLKATMLADLSRVDTSRPTQPTAAPVISAHANPPATVNAAFHRVIVIPNEMLFVPAWRAIQPVSLKFIVVQASYSLAP